MKKTLSIILMLIMAFAVIGNAAARPDMHRNCSGDALDDAVAVAFIPSGDGENAIGYYEDEEANAGPESFAVNDGNVYVLDSVKNRIVAVEDGAARYIPVSGIDHPSKFTLVGDRFYIVGSGISVMDINGRILRSVSFPEKVAANDIYRVYSNGNELCMLTHDLECFKLNSSDYEWIKDCQIGVDGRFEQIETLSLPNVKVDLDVGPTCLVQYLQHSESELLVGVYEFVPYLPVIETEYTVRKYDMQGQLLGCTVVNNLEAYSLPATVVNVDPYTGIVYTMLCREDGVYITKPNFRIEYQSHMDELAEIAESILASDGKAVPMRYTTVTDQTRAQVLARADDAIEHQWTIYYYNLPPINSTTIGRPAQFSGLNEDNTPATATGIPYCWGGYFLDFHNQNNTGFDDLLGTSITGNTISSHVNGTIGLDCSGFVSYAYNTTYHGTSTLISYGHYVNGNQSNSTYECSMANLKYMDFLVKYTQGATNNHTLLYYDLSTSDIVYTRESTKMNNDCHTATDYQGTKIRELAIENLAGYRLRTPYACGGTETCVPGGDYSSNSTKHWQNCIHCGEDEDCPRKNHSWSDYLSDSTKHWKQCTVCERHKNEAPHTWSVYQYDSTKHWKECSECGRHKNETSHSLSGYQYNEYYHWQNCTVCGYSTINEPHCWVHISNGYHCSTCGAYSHIIPLPEKAPVDMETK